MKYEPHQLMCVAWPPVFSKLQEWEPWAVLQGLWSSMDYDGMRPLKQLTNNVCICAPKSSVDPAFSHRLMWSLIWHKNVPNWIANDWLKVFLGNSVLIAKWWILISLVICQIAFCICTWQNAVDSKLYWANVNLENKKRHYFIILIAFTAACLSPIHTVPVFRSGVPRVWTLYLHRKTMSPWVVGHGGDTVTPSLATVCHRGELA